MNAKAHITTLTEDDAVGVVELLLRTARSGVEAPVLIRVTPAGPLYRVHAITRERHGTGPNPTEVVVISVGAEIVTDEPFCQCGEPQEAHIDRQPCNYGEPREYTSLHQLPIFGRMWKADGRDLHA